MPNHSSRTAPKRRRRARGSITPEEVIRGAFEICESETVDGLSMPRLAQHLGAGVTSIYWYFKSKEELLDALTAEAFRRFYARMPPLEGRKWDDVLREFFTNFRSILRDDEVLCDLCIMRTGHYTDDTIRITWTRIEEILEVLVAAGFSDASATHAYFSLSVYTRGALFVERSLRAGGIDPGMVRNPRVELAEAMPVMSRQLGQYNWYMVSDDDFHFGLETILTGLRASLAADKKAARSATGSSSPGGSRNGARASKSTAAHGA